MSATGLPEGEWKSIKTCIAVPDVEYGIAASMIRNKIEEAVLPILKELEASGKLRGKAVKSVGHIMDDAEGTLRGVWKYSWLV